MTEDQVLGTEWFCELCKQPGVKLSSGLVICPECFWGGRLTIQFLNRRFRGYRIDHNGKRANDEAVSA